MTFVSYAQNFEDLMLWRALKHVENGFYVDIGALSPNHDTVTKAFYERGWRGINCEPNKIYLDELRKFRPNELNLGVAVSDKNGTVNLNITDNPGLSTIEAEIAEGHRRNGLSVEVAEVEAMTIDRISKEYIDPNQEVHFLKVDVEGHEASVIRGCNWTRFRPWIIVIEATYPNSQVTTHEQWEAILLNAKYQFVYWDGLNRFYLAEEHIDLKDAFLSPPNVFDDYELARYTEIIARLKSELEAALGV